MSPAPALIMELPKTQTAQPGAAMPAAASATPDTRLPPERWMEWPMVPQATSRARQVYELGQTLGADPRALSKVGDCQSIEEALMGNFDRPGRYRLPADQPYLQETIDWFAGSFIRDGYAVKGGFNAASVLSPMWADPQACQPGETPLVCEFRIHRPSFAIISLEVWWEGRTAERYMEYMRTIIDYALARGVVPILSTKADNVEGDHSLNLATARLAYEYDLPLWNFWAAAQTLPNGGLDPLRNDGFHLAEDAWATRSLTALQALDSVWRGVRGVGLPAAVTTATPRTVAATSTPPVALQPHNLSGRLVFGLARRREDQLEHLGVFAVEPQTGAMTQLLGEGFDLQAVSPDGRQMLANRGSQLFLLPLDGSAAQLLSDKFFDAGRRGALWQPGGQRLVVITNGGSQNTAWIVDTAGGVWDALSRPGDNPVELYPTAEDGIYVFANGVCPGDGVCTVGEASGAWQAGLLDLSGVHNPTFSPDGRWMAYTAYDKDGRGGLAVASLDRKLDRRINLGGTAADYRLMDTAWSPDGQKLSLLILARSEYSGKWFDIRHVVLTPANWGTQEFPPISGLNPHVTWAPDGGSLLLSSTVQLEGGGYRVSFKLFDVASRQMRLLDGTMGLEDADVLVTTNMFWVK